MPRRVLLELHRETHRPSTAVPVPKHLVPVLVQLMSGVPDVAASRKLNMSARTFSRRVAELLSYIGVESRFQAGVEAARRGWVPHRNQPDAPAVLDLHALSAQSQDSGIRSR